MVSGAPAATAGGHYRACVRDAATLTLTGERTLPGIWHENYWFRRHEAAYVWAERFVRGALVLDAGCGEGYGSDQLARAAYRVFAVDRDSPAAAHAAGRYPRVRIVRAGLEQLPFATASLEVVVALQVIEHVVDQPSVLREVARVLRPAGTVLLSTPNRLTFTPGSDRPVNPFHTREVSATELQDLVAPWFLPWRVAGVHHGRRLSRWNRRRPGLVARQLATPPADWPRALRRRVAQVRADDFDVRADRIDESLDLLLLGIRRP
jgi:2-polyprenyl-3-methyl-5-hydroxy-6-metoxy-1,4-benzoquinol methylase